MKRIELVSDNDLEMRLADHLRQGRMPDPFLYIGESGANNWLTLDSSDDFPVATRLQDLLEQSIPELAECIPSNPNVVSLGVGSGEKERILLRALMQSGSPRYVAVDISGPMVDAALNTAADLDIEKSGVVAFVEDLPLIREHWTSPVVLCLMGNNFSNYDPGVLLTLVREQLTPNDMFLFDCHLLPDASEYDTWRHSVERIYGSAQNALFNMGPLIQRGANPSDCAFHLELITVDSPAGPSIRTRKWLDVARNTSVRCGSCEVDLARGSRIELGFTFKHTLPQVRCHLARQGFGQVGSFVSQSGENLLVLTRIGESA